MALAVNEINTDEDATAIRALARRLSLVRLWSIVGAALWLALVAGTSYWYTQRVIAKYVAAVANNSQREARSAASIIDRSFNELDSISQVLARQIYVRDAVLRHAKIAAEFSTLPREERAQRLKGDTQAVTSGDELKSLATRLGYDIIFVMDRSGTTVVSSDWRATPSIIGQAHADRSYFINAMKTGTGRLFAVGRTTGVAGFYFSARVTAADGATGVVVVRQPTETFARLIPSARHHVLIMDRMGVIVTASDKSMLMRHAGALAWTRPDEKNLRSIYARDRLETLDVVAPPTRLHGEHWLLAGAPYIASIAQLEESDYMVMVMTPMDALKSILRFHLIIALLLAAVGVSLAFVIHGVVANQARRQTAAKRLGRLNQRLIAANEEKNRYLGIASHDLRNPLSSMRGLSQLMMEMPLEPAQKQQFLETIHRTSDEMLTLVNDLLDVAQIESGKLDVKREIRDLGKLVEERLVLLVPMAVRKNIQIKHATQGDLTAGIDAARFSQVIDNLISNAVKFSPAGTSVHVTIAGAAGSVKFAVEDEGPGISEVDREKLFKNFQKLSARPTGGEKSTGLGLAIVKKIVDAHEGSIVVESGAGGGARFVVTVPASSTNDTESNNGNKTQGSRIAG